MSEALGIYLFGSALAVFLGIVLVIEGYIITWATKDNVLRKNLEKIGDPKQSSLAVNVGTFLLGLLFGAVMSWLGVLQYLLQIVWVPIKTLRELFSSVPEEIKLLRFPLKNNPYLSREAVFAYFYALRVKAGSKPSVWEITDELNTISGYYPSFSKEGAIHTLESLAVVDKEMISNALETIRGEIEED